MACPTCDHTMQTIHSNCSWCPRCGTLKNGLVFHDTPKLVTYCRRFQKLDGFTTTPGYGEVQKAWHRLGIEESINAPAARATK